MCWAQAVPTPSASIEHQEKQLKAELSYDKLKKKKTQIKPVFSFFFSESSRIALVWNQRELVCQLIYLITDQF